MVSIVALVKARQTGAGKGLAIGGVVASLLIIPILAAIALPLYTSERDRAAEEDVRDAFHRSTQALIDADCDAFLDTSTASYRMSIGIVTCDDFDWLVGAIEAEGFPLGHVPVVEVEVDGDTAILTTLETAAWGGRRVVERYEYQLVRADGTWRVNAVTFVD